MNTSGDPIYVCGFCKHRMPRGEATLKVLGGRDTYNCPRCKGPCRPDDSAAAEPPAAAVPAAPAPAAPPRLTGPRSTPPPLVGTTASTGPTPASLAESGEQNRLGLRRRASDPHPAHGVPASPVAGTPAAASATTIPDGGHSPVEAAQLFARVQQHVEKEARRRASREAPIRSIWSAYWFWLKPLSFLAILLMMAIFSSQSILGDMAMEDEIEDERKRAAAEAAEAAAAGEDADMFGGEDEDFFTGMVGGPVAPDGKEVSLLDRYIALGPDPVPATPVPAGTGNPGGFSSAGMIAGLAALTLSSMIFQIFFLMYFSALMLNIIYETGNGREFFPRWPNPIDIVDSFLLPAWLFFLAFVVSFGPAVACFVLPFLYPAQVAWLWLAAPLVFLLGCLYFPMTLMCAAMRSESSAVMPGVVLPAIAKAHVYYLPVLLAFLLMPAWPFLRVWLRQAEHGPHGWQLVLLDYFVQFTLLVIGMRALGLLYRRIEHSLGWLQFRAV